MSGLLPGDGVMDATVAIRSCVLRNLCLVASGVPLGLVVCQHWLVIISACVCSDVIEVGVTIWSYMYVVGAAY